MNQPREYILDRWGHFQEITSMASTAKQNCAICNQPLAAVLCSGCDKWLCQEHLHAAHGEWPAVQRFERRPV